MTESISNVAVAEGAGIRVRWPALIVKFLREKPLGAIGAIMIIPVGTDLELVLDANPTLPIEWSVDYAEA